MKFPIITTKGGDAGETSLWSGERVSKNNPAIKCVCEFDLLDSHMGILHSHLKSYPPILKVIKKIQDRLVSLKGELATHPRGWSDYKKNNKPIVNRDVEYLDLECKKLREELSIQNYQITGWIQYGSEGEVSSQLDYARGIVRKCEISLYDLDENINGESVSKYIKQYTNRLSDLLFLMARYVRED